MGKYQFLEIGLPNGITVTEDQMKNFDISGNDKKYEWVSKTIPQMNQCTGNTHFLCMVRHPEKRNCIHVAEIPGYCNMLRFALSIAYYGKYDVDVRANSRKNDERYKFTMHFNDKKEIVDARFDSTFGVFEEEDPHMFMKPKED